MDMEFYDCHSHFLENQKGGFIIALEGEPLFENTYNNNSVIEVTNMSKELIPVQYVTKEFNEVITKVVKYHPRREKYKVDEVILDIAKKDLKIVIIDTLNEPYWKADDYWRVAQSFPEKTFIFPHSGGYLINEFIKICDFQSNVWLDFSLTQHYFGWVGDRPKLKYVNEAIEYALQHKKLSRKILFGSDNTFFSQQEAVNKYFELSNAKSFLVDNFYNILEQSNLI